jgi:DNA repair exonuclease SbcCD nuclease subunit
VIIIKGTPSHDGENLPSLSKFLKDLKNLTIIDTCQEIQDFCCIPEPTLDNIESSVKLLTSTKCKYCVFHGNVESAVYPSGQPVDANSACCIKKDVFKKFDFTFLGHIHKAQWITGLNACYAGSLGRWCFGEEEPKGCFIHDFLGNKVTSQFVDILSPEYKTYYIATDSLEQFINDYKTTEPIRIILNQPLTKLISIPKYIKVESKVEKTSITENQVLNALVESELPLRQKVKTYIQEKLKINVTSEITAVIDEVVPAEIAISSNEGES